MQYDVTLCTQTNIDLLMYDCKNIRTTTILLSNLSCMSVVHMMHKFIRTKLLLL